MKNQITRRRFLTITAATIASTANADANATPLRWQGHALGAQTSLTIHAPRPKAERALRDIRQLLMRVESLFSLYEPASQLSRLNAAGFLDAPDPALVKLLHLAGRVHAATEGLFDPTIQPLWQALATGKDPASARSKVDWNRVSVRPARIILGAQQALTLNGIAQGYATDMAVQILRKAGLQKVLVNIGEFAALGGPFTLGISDPVQGLVDTARLTNRAIATSSPAAMQLAHGQTHILHPAADLLPQWSTVSVEADSAGIADAASTAFCLMSAPQVQRSLRQLAGTPRAMLINTAGEIRRLG